VLGLHRPSIAGRADLQAFDELFIEISDVQVGHDAHSVKVV